MTKGPHDGRDGMTAGWTIKLLVALSWLVIASPVHAQSTAPNQPKSLEGGLKTYIDITARIARSVTPAHLAECKRLIETAGGVFSRKLIGPLTPNPVGTCAVTFRAFFQPPLQDRAVWAATATMSGGLMSKPADRTVSCVMRLENGRIIVDPNGPATVTNHCQHLQQLHLGQIRSQQQPQPAKK
jgi:hypothetical protein